MGHHEVLVLEVDPIRELITVLLPDDVKVSVNPGELFTTKPEEEKPRRSYKRGRVEEPSSAFYQDKPRALEEKPASVEDRLEDTDMNFDFSVFVLNMFGFLVAVVAVLSDNQGQHLWAFLWDLLQL